MNKNNKKRNKRIAIVLACILIPLGAFGFGYFFRNQEGTKSVSHTLTVDGSINGVASENNEDVECDTNGIVPGDSVSVPISIKPNSTADSLLRVKVEPYWVDKDKDGNDLSNINLELIEIDVSDNTNGDKWYKDQLLNYS